MLSGIMLVVITLNAIIQTAIMANVMAPEKVAASKTYLHFFVQVSKHKHTRFQLGTRLVKSPTSSFQLADQRHTIPPV
jgi:hypothetical protein